MPEDVADGGELNGETKLYFSFRKIICKLEQL